MAAPTTTFSAAGAGTITATGEDNGLLLALNRKNTNPRVVLGFSGTFTNAVLAVRGRMNGLDQFYPVPARLLKSGLPVADSGAIALANSANQAIEFDASGFDALEVYGVSGTLTDLDVEARQYAGAGPFPVGPTFTGAGFTGATFAGTSTFSGPSVHSDVGTVAAAGSAQGDAAALANETTYVSAADGTKGVVLPAAAAGLVRYVYNTHASNGLKVYPASGDDINDATQDAAVTIEGKSLAIFRALDATTWAAIYTANS